MNHFATPTVFAFTALLALSACSDPADAVPAASSEAPAAEAPAEPAPTGSTLRFSNDGSTIGFTGSKVTGSHDGTFGEFSGEVSLSPDGVEASRVSLTIQMASLEADAARLTTHLRSADFFDVANIPTSTFESTSITAGGEGEATHTVAGNLTMHGQTRAIRFPATITVGDGVVDARAEFSIDRTDFGITYPGMQDDLIRNDVVIRFNIHATGE